MVVDVVDVDVEVVLVVVVYVKPVDGLWKSYSAILVSVFDYHYTRPIARA